MAGDAAGRTTTIAAFGANLGIAAGKFVAWAVTGSASMLAEAVHSVADTGNQGLLLWGRRRSRRDANRRHPFGHGRERYFWGFVVAMVLFSGGSLFALVEGEEKLRRPHELSSYTWSAVVLVLGLLLEGWSLRTAVRESRHHKRRGERWRDFVRRTTVPELAVVLLEDTGALIGLGLALAGTTTAELTGDPRWDAVGSIGIGVLLAGIAFTLAREMQSMLIGEAAPRHDVDRICTVLTDDPAVDRIDDLRTEQLGPDDILVVGAVTLGRGADGDAAEAAARLRDGITRAVPAAHLVYLNVTDGR